MSLRLISFDAAGTLLHLPKGVGWHYREVALRFGTELDEDRLKLAFGRAFHSLSPPATTRSPRPDDDRGWWRALVEGVLDACGAPASFPRDAYFAALYREFTLPGVWALYPEVREVLAGLAPRYRLAVISNFDGRLRTVLRHEGIDGFFEIWSISSEAGADKPDPWIYEKALQEAGVSPHEALHAGDDPELDWAAARQVGMRVFELDRPRNSLRDLLGLI